MAPVATHTSSVSIHTFIWPKLSFYGYLVA